LTDFMTGLRLLNVIKLSHLILLAGLLSPCVVMAKDIRFDYVQLVFTSGTVDLSDTGNRVDGSGIGLKISLGFSPTYAFTLAVIDTTFGTFHNVMVDEAKATTIGITAHTLIKPDLAVFANLSALKAEITTINGAGTGTDSDYGYAVNAGLRYSFNNRLELEVAATHAFVFSDFDHYAKVDLRVYLRDRISLGMGYVTGDVVDAFLFNLRLDV